MPRDTSELIEDFGRDGVENSDFDAKSRPILDSSEGRKKLVKRLTAFANSGGGTVIVGLQRNDDDLEFQSIDADREVRKQLTDIARHYSDSRLTECWDIHFVQHSGVRLLRIDVDAPENRPIPFFEDEDPEMFVRVEDSTEEMTKREVAEFVEESLTLEESDLFWDGESKMTLHVGSQLGGPDVPNFNNPEGRLITSITDYGMVVFCGRTGLDPIGNNLFFHTQTSITASTPSEVLEVIQLAENHLEARLDDFEFGYTIRLGDRQLHGRGVEDMIDDIEGVESVIEHLVAAHETGPTSEHSLTGDPRPILVAHTATNFGALWIEMQWRNGAWTRAEIGLIMDDIPFDQEPLKSFFSELGHSPRYFEQENGTQMLSLNGPRVELANHEVRTLTPGYSDVPLHAVADNPLYQMKEELGKRVDAPLPDYILDPVVNTSRIPFQIKGGYADGDVAFESERFDILFKSLMHPVVFVDTLCHAMNPDYEMELP